MYSDIPKPIIKPNLKPSTKATSKEGVRKNIEWLKTHHDEYKGQWVVLDEGIFLGADKSSVKLHQNLKDQLGKGSSAVFINLKIERA
jgi:hypothetical protein